MSSWTEICFQKQVSELSKNKAEVKERILSSTRVRITLYIVYNFVCLTDSKHCSSCASQFMHIGIKEHLFNSVIAILVEMLLNGK